MKLYNLKVKVITGFRDDQFMTISAEEAHKAYYLFMKPEARAVFSNGVALIGKSIQGIEPDYHSTMGWNNTHKLDSDDWNELDSKGISNSMRNLLEKASLTARLVSDKPELLQIPLSEITGTEQKSITSGLANKFTIRN